MRRLRTVSFALITFAAASGGAAPALAVTSHPSAVRAPAAPAAVAGYISVYQGAEVPYYDYDSAAGQVAMKQLGTGQYRISFGGMGGLATSAIAQASTFGSPAICVVGDLAASAGRLQAVVSCFGATSGQHVNSGFDVIITRATRSAHGRFDYAFDGKPAFSGTLTSREFNSAGKKNTVRHLGTGRYRVTFGGQAAAGTSGTVKVTAYGTSAGFCDPVSWTGSAAGEVVTVDCFGARYAPQNKKFMVSYAASGSLLGLGGQTVANVLADGSTASYQPPVQYDSAAGAAVTVTRRYAGGYQLMLTGSEGDNTWGGDVEVDAVGSAGLHCEIPGWTEQATPVVNIFCYNSHGVLTDSPFTVQWVVP